MSLAYLCDQCPAKAVIDKGALHLPSGWVEATMEKGTGVMHNPKSTKHSTKGVTLPPLRGYDCSYCGLHQRDCLCWADSKTMSAFARYIREVACLIRQKQRWKNG